jgi:hypothetical protein
VYWCNNIFTNLGPAEALVVFARMVLQTTAFSVHFFARAATYATMPLPDAPASVRTNDGQRMLLRFLDLWLDRLQIFL